MVPSAISSLRIWDRALSASEVKAYNRGRLDEPLPLINAITNNISVNPLKNKHIYVTYEPQLFK